MAFSVHLPELIVLLPPIAIEVIPRNAASAVSNVTLCPSANFLSAVCSVGFQSAKKFFIVSEPSSDCLRDSFKVSSGSSGKRPFSGSHTSFNCFLCSSGNAVSAWEILRGSSLVFSSIMSCSGGNSRFSASEDNSPPPLSIRHTNGLFSD